MEMFEALEAFSSLSQETRLKVFRLVIEYGTDGIIPGKIAEDLNIPDNTLSFHLSNQTAREAMEVSNSEPVIPE